MTDFLTRSIIFEKKMTQTEKRRFLIEYLLNENQEFSSIKFPQNEAEQKRLLRSLFNVRPAVPASEEFLRVQDEYLKTENESRGITDIADLTPIFGNLYLWRGDITTLKVGAIVNAANSAMTGCYVPCHACIDNCIHTFSGVQLRAFCDAIIKKQGHEEKTGGAKITPSFNLPCDFVIHTVGPIISGTLRESDCKLLESCYKNCLDIAEKNGVKSIAFCCISTGVFRFPAKNAAQIAVSAVQKWQNQTKSAMKIVFNVFSEKDEAIYKAIFKEIL